MNMIHWVEMNMNHTHPMDESKTDSYKQDIAMSIVCIVGFFFPSDI